MAREYIFVTLRAGNTVLNHRTVQNKFSKHLFFISPWASPPHWIQVIVTWQIKPKANQKCKAVEIQITGVCRNHLLQNSEASRQ